MINHGFLVTMSVIPYYIYPVVNCPAFIWSTRRISHPPHQRKKVRSDGSHYFTPFMCLVFHIILGIWQIFLNMSWMNESRDLLMLLAMQCIWTRHLAPISKKMRSLSSKSLLKLDLKKCKKRIKNDQRTEGFREPVLEKKGSNYFSK